ncbi:MAG: YaaL family protein [Eubacteriales bacterium]|nr:YaaL family protein [Eubacteriales bacterium]
MQKKASSREYFRENMELKAEIDRTRSKMDTVCSLFEEAVDPTLIDCYIYELKAVQLRYQFLLRRFKVLEELCASRQS